jgi:hypothetical protein
MARALELRDAALGLVRTRGAWVPVPVDGKDVRFLMAEANGVRVMYRTQFQRGPDSPKPGTYAHAVAMQRAKPGLPHALDVWAENEKVLNIQWSERGEVDLVSFQRGTWESRLLAAIG